LAGIASLAVFTSNGYDRSSGDEDIKSLPPHTITSLCFTSANARTVTGTFSSHGAATDSDSIAVAVFTSADTCAVNTAFGINGATIDPYYSTS
jgi:hypothetical protein